MEIISYITKKWKQQNKSLVICASAVCKALSRSENIKLVAS